MKQYASQYLFVLKQLGLLMILYSISRVLFYLFNVSWYEDLAGVLLIKAMGMGFVFDLSAIFYCNLVLMVLALLPFSFVHRKGYQVFLKISFVVINGLALLLNLIDIAYVAFNGRRSDLFTAGILQDATQQAGQLIANYWYISLLGIGMIFLLWRFYPKTQSSDSPLHLPKALLFFLSFVAIAILGIRGGIGGYPLTPIHAYQTGKPDELAFLTLNTPFTVISSIGKKPLESLRFMEEEELSSYLGPPFLKEKTPQDSPQNVVIILLESNSAEFSGHLRGGTSHTPFLDSLAGVGHSFHNAFANGRTSAEAISSILTGLPSLFNGFVSSSIYQSNRYYSLFSTLAQSGYQTGFYHGGANGTMFFDSWARKMGIPYFGLNEYPHPDDHDGHWGIFDGPYLQYVAQELNDYQQPFATAVLTLSAHQPFSLPEGYDSQANADEAPIYGSIRYTDEALADFFETAKQMPWFENTLFVITADHAYPVVKSHEEWLELYRIPIVLYHPSQTLEADSLQMVEQVDIPISIADYLGIEAGPFPQFGRSFFRPVPETEQDALFFVGLSWFLIKRNYMLRFDGKDQLTVMDWQQHLLPTTQASELDIQHLKAYIQSYNSRMINNTFVPLHTNPK